MFWRARHFGRLGLISTMALVTAFGSYLNVHEGPQRIAKGADTTALMPGMILSNEPGFYQEGQYGIRIENFDRGATCGKLIPASLNLKRSLLPPLPWK